MLRHEHWWGSYSAPDTTGGYCPKTYHFTNLTGDEEKKLNDYLCEKNVNCPANDDEAVWYRKHKFPKEPPQNKECDLNVVTQMLPSVFNVTLCRLYDHNSAGC